MAANEDFLGLLHDATAKALMAKLKGTEVLDPDTGEVAHVILPTAADIQAAAKFLKDNNITCAPSDDNKLGELRDALADRNKRRETRRATRQELSEASREASFIKGLN